jgi:hypothetical protein
MLPIIQLLEEAISTDLMETAVTKEIVPGQKDNGQRLDQPQTGESGISHRRATQEISIAPYGDTILEFANTKAEWVPVLRFRVSSYMLAETSPIFASMFSGCSKRLETFDDISGQLPEFNTSYVCQDGTEVKLYRMPQLEFNKEQSLEILLHAAHMHNDKVPREVSFEQFVAIAEVCLRYQCTSPLEVFVEHRWLPAWMHRATDDKPDGLLVISYAFGLRQLFTRMTKTAILNIADEKELQGKPWPQKIRDKIWTVRCAKMAQLHACCITTVQEYLRPPANPAIEQPDSAPPIVGLVLEDLRSSTSPPVSTATALSAPSGPLLLTSTPRCPKGSHGCDATNLGWLMLIYAELQLLPSIMKPQALGHLGYGRQSPHRSLAQMVDALRLVPSPPQPVHRGGVCDPAPAFRTAVNDIYNSVSGLTLFDINGKNHGWALSRSLAEEPQPILRRRPRSMVAASTTGKFVELPDAVRMRILVEVHDLGSLHAAARVNKGFYDTYKRNELMLMRNIVKADRRRTLRMSNSSGESCSGSGACAVVEDKSLKLEADSLKPVEIDGSADSTSGSDGSEEEEKDDEDGDGDGDSLIEEDAAEDHSGFARPISAPMTPTGSSPEDAALVEQHRRTTLFILEQGISAPTNASASRSQPDFSSLRPTQGLREKFLVNGPLVTEDKVLVSIGQKLLRDDRDTLIKD